MPIPWLNSITLAGGSGFTGMNLCLTFLSLRTYGLQPSLKNDEQRQTVLNGILWIGACACFFVYPLNQEASQVMLINILNLILFSCIQFGLVIINHNTIFRFRVAFPDIKIFQIILNHYKYLYIIPFLTLTPIYFAAYESIPHNRPLNQSEYNTKYFKPLNVGLVLITEFFAVITDMNLLIRVGDVTNSRSLKRTEFDASNGSGHTSSSKSLQINWKKIRKYNVKDLWIDYGLIWLTLVIDVSIKLLISFGVKLLFDSSISITTMALRARLNLRYDLLIKSMLSTRSIPPSESKPEQNTKSCHQFQLAPKSLEPDSLDFSNHVDGFLDFEDSDTAFGNGPTVEEKSEF
ncbi:hypothetical protein BC833DRAFT_608779 [Globomyces pollinis-pini]|nr:hypothetical protein BC833DRAFT_608779 [Globomyces pollinis-pini]